MYPLSNRQFGRLWSTTLAGFASATVVSLALPLISLNDPSNPLTIVPLITAALGIPWVLFGIPAGILVDRYKRRSILAAAYIVRALVLATLWLCLSFELFPVIFLLILAAFLSGSALVFQSTASQALLPSIVPKEERTVANTWQLRATTGIELLSLVLAASISERTSPSAPLILAATLATFSAILAMSIRETATSRDTSPQHEPPRLLDGFRTLLSTAELRQTTFTTTVWRISAGVGTGLTIPFLTVGLAADGPLLGAAIASIGMGAFLGTLILPTLNKRLDSAPLWRRTLAIGALAGVLRALPYDHPTFHLIVFIIGGCVIGCSLSIVTILTVTQRHNLVTRTSIGQASAAFSMLTWGALPIGSLLSAPLLTLMEPGAAFLAGSAVLLVCPAIATLPPLGRARTLD